jgi:hypothetical protein
MKTYQCPTGEIVLLDDDVELPGRLSIGSHGYAQIAPNKVNGFATTTLLHRWLMGCTVRDGQLVDHRDRNKLNCQRSNLRITTPSGNNQNRTPGPRANAYPNKGRWIARVKLRGHMHNLGTYDTPEEAQAVAAAWKQEHFTELVCT